MIDLTEAEESNPLCSRGNKGSSALGPDCGGRQSGSDRVRLVDRALRRCPGRRGFPAIVGPFGSRQRGPSRPEHVQSPKNFATALKFLGLFLSAVQICHLCRAGRQVRSAAGESGPSVHFLFGPLQIVRQQGIQRFAVLFQPLLIFFRRFLDPGQIHIVLQIEDLDP